MRGNWDGRAFTDLSGDFERARKSFQRLWRRAGGRSDGAFKFLERYSHYPENDEPRWLLQPWAFVKTAPGWSTVADGCLIPGSIGMRGVTRSDIFYPLAMVYHLEGPRTFSIRRGASLLRFHPIPRSLQDARLETLRL